MKKQISLIAACAAIIFLIVTHFSNGENKMSDFLWYGVLIFILLALLLEKILNKKKIGIVNIYGSVLSGIVLFYLFFF